MKNAMIEFYKSSDRDTARYVSGTTVYEECLDNGRFIHLYWSSSGQVQREELVDLYPMKDMVYTQVPVSPLEFPINTFYLEIDGQSLQNGWAWVDSFTREGERGTVEAVTVLSHKLRPVTLRVVTVLDGSAVLTRHLEIANTGEMPAALSHVRVMSGMPWFNQYYYNIPFNESVKPMYSLGYFRSQKQGEEGNFVWQPLDSETFRVEKSRGNMFYNPYFILKNEVNGECFYIALAWSENFEAEFSFDRVHKTLSFSIGPFGPSPLRVIAPGETITTPKVHIGPMRGNIDRCVENWYGHLRSSVIPERPENKKKFVLSGRVVEHPGDWILCEIDIAAEMGAEVFIMDAGWYGKEFKIWPENRGDWTEGDFLPKGGVAAIRDYTHEKGMLFGMWMEPECLSTASETFREHPDWSLRSDVFGHSDTHILIDLSNEKAAKYVEESILNVIGGFKLDFYKTDYNQRVPEGGLNLRDGFAENEAWRHYETLYRIYDRVRKEYPDVVLESCAAGGGRQDLGMMSRFHYMSQSDFSYFPRSIRSINALTLFLPPEALIYYHNHFSFAHEMADIDTHLRVTLFANSIHVGFGAQNQERTGTYFEKTKRYIALSKEYCREVMSNHPVVFHHTPYIGLTEPVDWCVLEYATPDKTRGYAGFFRLGVISESSEYIFKPRGIDPSRSYNVTFDNRQVSGVISGTELSQRGLSVSLENANTSELIFYSVV